MRIAITTRPLPVTPRVKEAWDDVGNCFERFCLTAGIEALQAMLEADAAELCGDRHARSAGRVGYRWGTTQGKVPFHGGNVDVARPRVRRCGHGGSEPHPIGNPASSARRCSPQSSDLPATAKSP